MMVIIVMVMMIVIVMIIIMMVMVIGIVVVVVIVSIVTVISVILVVSIIRKPIDWSTESCRREKRLLFQYAFVRNIRRSYIQNLPPNSCRTFRTASA